MEHPCYDIHRHHRAGEATLPHTLYSLTPEELIATPPHTFPHLSLSLHPWHATPAPLPLQAYATRCQERDIAAIGECGIDTLCATPLPLQLEIFRSQIALSEETEKPLIIHSVRAFHQLLQLHKELRPHQTWIVHGFRGKPQVAQQLQRVGIHLSLGEKFHPQLPQTIQLDQLYFETDTSNRPIAHIYQAFATAAQMEVVELRERIARNIARTLPLLYAEDREP